MYGVIDIGSNTIRLVIYKYNKEKLKPIINKKFSVGLASYITNDGTLCKDGIDKTTDVLHAFKEIIDATHVKTIFPFATASLRNITNSKEVLHELKEKTGFNVQILSGTEEATYDFYGSLQSVDLDEGLMIDIGGGSTELVFFKNQKIDYATSLPIGSLNLYKAHVDDLVPTKKELKKIKNDVLEHLENLELPSSILPPTTMCGVGGTARATQKLLKDLNRLYTDSYTCDQLTDLLQLCKDEPSKFYRNLLKSSADRLHTFATGLVIFNEIAKYYHCDSVVTSQYGVREGYLLNQIKEEMRG